MLHWRQLVYLSDEELAAFDVAEVNLACAAELPGAEEINHEECIDRLNHYARCARHYTEKQLERLHTESIAYNQSENIFRIMCMIQLLWKQFGIRYNPAKIPIHVPFNTADSFIHGALMGEGGTCASLPVVYVAVGRRLGYPLKLVPCKQHLFARWEEQGGERFNIEGNETGLVTPPDDHYRWGRYEVSREREEAWCLLQSQTPRQELAEFLAQRGCRWADLGRIWEALEALQWAAILDPRNRLRQGVVRHLMNKWYASGAAGVVPIGPIRKKIDLDW